MSEPLARTYLGDGLYAEFYDDDFQIRLYAPREDGIHEVYLEPQVLINFLEWVESLKGIMSTQ